MEFCLNFSVGFTTPPLMLVIRNLVLVHKVKSKEAVSSAYAERGRGQLSTSVHRLRGPTVVISKYNNLKRLVPTGPSFKGQEAFQSISEYEIWNFTSPVHISTSNIGAGQNLKFYKFLHRFHLLSAL